MQVDSAGGGRQEGVVESWELSPISKGQQLFSCSCYTGLWASMARSFRFSI